MTVEKLKIISSIDGECGSCINQLNRWKKILPSLKFKDAVEFIPIIYTSDLQFFESNMLPKFKSKLPLYFDKKNKFIEQNKLYLYDPILYTFLLDANNKVVLVGNPIYNDELMELYREEINKRIN